jgi:hypothetical protein
MDGTYRSWVNRGAAAAGLGAILFLAGACTGGRPGGEPLLTTRAGDLGWKLWLEPDPPRQKGNTLWLEVQESSGVAVEGAEVTFEYQMPAMGAMPEMRGKGEVAEVGEGFYHIDFDFPMRGTWRLTLTVASDRDRAGAEYSLTVGRAGLRETGARSGGTTVPGGYATIASKLAPLELAEQPLGGGAPTDGDPQTEKAGEHNSVGGMGMLRGTLPHVASEVGS